MIVLAILRSVLPGGYNLVRWTPLLGDIPRRRANRHMRGRKGRRTAPACSIHHQLMLKDGQLYADNTSGMIHLDDILAGILLYASECSYIYVICTRD
jgi:hypothetical protein